MRLLLVALLTLSACGGPAEWTEVDPSALAPDEAARLGRAKEAAGKLGERLLGRLAEEVSSRGLAAAVDVCRTAAPEIAAAVEGETGLLLGRTSHRLRNPANRAPAWAAPVLAGNLEDAGRPRVFLSPEGRMGVTLPIRLKAMCASCHGAPDRLDPAVRERLAALYPEDAATGFAEGDVRGVFWVELPADR